MADSSSFLELGLYKRAARKPPLNHYLAEDVSVLLFLEVALHRVDLANQSQQSCRIEACQYCGDYILLSIAA